MGGRIGLRHGLLIAAAAIASCSAGCLAATAQDAASPELGAIAPLLSPDADHRLFADHDRLFPAAEADAARPATAVPAAALPPPPEPAAQVATTPNVVQLSTAGTATAARDPRYASFGARVGAVKWEMAAAVAALTAINLPKDLKDGSAFHFHDEGVFGRSTQDLGVDKLAHAYNAYLFSEIMYARMARKTGGGAPTAATAALLGFALQAYGEVYDGFERTSGWSWQDTGFNALGAGFSYVRNAVPGLKDKLDFRIEIVPNHEIYTYSGKEHYRQEHFLLALKLAGFEGLERSPLRFVELHAGYYASGFTHAERRDGDPLRRRPFVGIGINLQELLFPRPQGWLGRAGRTVLDYVQVPYTSVHYDAHGHLSY